MYIHSLILIDLLKSSPLVREAAGVGEGRRDSVLCGSPGGNTSVWSESGDCMLVLMTKSHAVTL